MILYNYKKDIYMNNTDKQYLQLLEDILQNGIKKEDRTGTGTISVFGRMLRFDLTEGFPLLTTKKMAWKSMVVELLWFLKGRTDLKYLLDNNCYIWVGDAYKRYNKENNDLNREEFIEKIKTDNVFSEKWGDLGKIYGHQWRNFNGVDQIENLINDLKNDPDSRRLIVNSWNVSDLDEMILPPCHYNFQCYTQELTFDERFNIFLSKTEGENIQIENGNVELTMDNLNIPKRKLSLMWNQRSIDTALGLPFNISSYALLLLILSNEVNMIPHELIASLGDTHIYLNHIEGVKEQLTRKSLKLPIMNILNDKKYYDYELSDFELVNYKSQEKIIFLLSN